MRTSLPLTDDEIADYGPEFLNVLQCVANHAAAPLRDEITTLRSLLGVEGQAMTTLSTEPV